MGIAAAGCAYRHPGSGCSAEQQACVMASRPLLPSASSQLMSRGISFAVLYCVCVQQPERNQRVCIRCGNCRGYDFALEHKVIKREGKGFVSGKVTVFYAWDVLAAVFFGVACQRMFFPASSLTCRSVHKRGRVCRERKTIPETGCSKKAANKQRRDSRKIHALARDVLSDTPWGLLMVS